MEMPPHLQKAARDGLFNGICAGLVFAVTLVIALYFAGAFGGNP